MSTPIQGPGESHFIRRVLGGIRSFRIGRLSQKSVEVSAKSGLRKTDVLSRSNQVLDSPSPSIPLSKRSAEQPLLSVLKEFLKSFLGLQKFFSEDFVTITTGRFGVFKLNPQILPPLPLGVSREALLDAIGEKIEIGGLLYEEIVKGNINLQDPEQRAKLEDISNLMWFLQAKAEEKAGSFTSGAISIEDADLRLLKYLDSCTDVYQRSSSHIKEFQFFESKSEELSGVHRGIDFNPEPYELSKPSESTSSSLSEHLSNILPHGKRTLLIAPMLAESGLISGNRLLLKMEAYGAHKFKPVGGDRPKAPASRQENPYDFDHAVGHAWEFLHSLIRTITGKQTKLGTKKERVPTKITNAYKKFIDELRKQELMAYAEVLEQNDPFSKSSGIRVMAQNIEDLIFILAMGPFTKDAASPFPNDLEKPINDLYNLITDPNQYDNYQVRIGNEVIFRTADLIFKDKDEG